MNDYTSKDAFGKNVMPTNTAATFKQPANTAASLPEQGNKAKANEKTIAKAVKSDATAKTGGGKFGSFVGQ